MKKNYTNIIKRICKDGLPENFYHSTCNNTRIRLFMREWKIHKIFANTFVISNFNIYNNMNDYIDFDYKKFQIYRHSNLFDTRKNITDDNSYQAELLLLWLVYFYYARY
jgi:hypothetical protein